jgi:hypothetical protein
MASPKAPCGPIQPALSSQLPDLYGLGARCLSEPASRRLDGEIYCAIHNVTDWNPLLNNQQFRARENGDVLLEHPGDGLVWIEAPPFTAELRYAEARMPSPNTLPSRAPPLTSIWSVGR